MELQQLLSEFARPLVVIILVSMIIMVKKIFSENKNSHNILLPPGPPKLPLIGNLHQLSGSVLLPQRLQELASEYGPVMHLQLGEVSTIIVSSPDAAKEVLITHGSIFSNRPHLIVPSIVTYGSQDIAFAPYGKYWRQLRKICTEELLAPRQVRSFRSIREEEVSGFIKSIADSAGSVINLSDKIFSLTTDITAKAAFGGKSKDGEAFVSFMEEGVKLATGFCLADLYPSSKLLYLMSGMRSKVGKLMKTSDRIIENIIANRRMKLASEEQGSGEALLDVLLKVQSASRLSTDGVKGLIMDMFSGGSETSSTTLEWTMSELLKNPEAMEKAQAEVRQVYAGNKIVDETSLEELKYLKLVIKETLRLHPPLPLLLPRESIETCQVYGYNLPTKTRAIINMWAMGRDSTIWTEASKFNPERFVNSSIDFQGSNFEYIPFGAGRRICPGISFALANVELPLAMLLYHFDWSLPNGIRCEDFDMTEAFALAMRRKNELYLVASIHPCSSFK
ncbi:hypothetical protein Ancab_040155 [Ancistrocladus abbreviatus]